MIITKRLTIREWALRDRASLPKLANDEKMAGSLRDSFPHPYTDKDAEQWLQFVKKEGQDLHLAIDMDDKLVGSIAAVFQTDIHRKNIEIGYWIAEPYRRQGIAFEAITAFVDFLFSKYKAQRIYTGIFSNNGPSMKLLEKIGFSCEAILKDNIYKRNEFLDEHIYTLNRNDYNKRVHILKSNTQGKEN